MVRELAGSEQTHTMFSQSNQKVLHLPLVKENPANPHQRLVVQHVFHGLGGGTPAAAKASDRLGVMAVRPE